jgi:hypothetical protein
MIADAVNETVKNSSGVTGSMEGFIKAVGAQFIKNKVANFPKMCEEARVANILTQQDFVRMGNTGGWSQSKDFKFDYTIPPELYNFMVNLVYTEFWTEANEKVWRSFMKAIVRGDDPIGLLNKVRGYYDTKTEV